MTPEDLLDLAKSANLLLEAARVHRRETIAKILAAGRLLTEHKAAIPHGMWGQYCERLSESKRTVNRYIRVAALGMSAHEILQAGGITYALGERVAEANTPPTSMGGVFDPDNANTDYHETDLEGMATESAVAVATDHQEVVTGNRGPSAPSKKDLEIRRLTATVAEQAALIDDQSAALRQAESEMADGPEADRYAELTAARADLNAAVTAQNRWMQMHADERRSRQALLALVKHGCPSCGAQLSFEHLREPEVPEWI